MEIRHREVLVLLNCVLRSQLVNCVVAHKGESLHKYVLLLVALEHARGELHDSREDQIELLLVFSGVLNLVDLQMVVEKTPLGAIFT